jgi:hypothetical protein
MFVTHLLNTIHAEKIAIGHVKLFCKDKEHEIKISLPTLDQDDWDKVIPDVLSKQVKLIVNGRMECAPAKINRLIRDALDATAQETGVMYTREASVYFRPRVSPTINSHME